jgi:hypothetical protein
MAKRPSLLFVADGRSPTALNWIRYFCENGWAVHLVSLFPCRPDLQLASLKIIPVAFSAVAGSETDGGRSSGRLKRALTPKQRAALRRIAAPWSLAAGARKLRGHLQQIQPDIVHAMRIPFEGMLTARALRGMQASDRPAYVQSIWGNDLTLHAPGSRWMRRETQRTLSQVKILHADCRRDIRLAREWGYAEGGPSFVIPGNGGIRSEAFYSEPRPAPQPEQLSVINPRGFRTYVHNEAFFRAIPAVSAVFERLTVICPNMAHEPQARQWLSELDIGPYVDLLPKVSQEQMARLYRSADIVVSLTSHDGTPNSLLEAMASGCFPVAGDLESIREWIEPGRNGSLVNPADSTEISAAIIAAGRDRRQQAAARVINVEMVKERASFSAGLERVSGIYNGLMREAHPD